MPDINMQVFEEVQRNQLVTEVDIQTQVALDDYQVQLSDIANPTQSQDNVIIDRYGEFLPHWNESLDFDTWVKMSMEAAGKRILMLRGNSNVSSASNGDNVFISFFNGDSEGWTEVDPNSRITFQNNRVEFAGILRNEDAYVYKEYLESSDIIIESTFAVTSGNAGGMFGTNGLGDIVDDLNNINNAFSGMVFYYGDNYKRAQIRKADTPTYGDYCTITDIATHYTTTELVGDILTTKWYSDSARTSLEDTSSVEVSGLPTMNYVYLFQSYNSGNSEYSITGWIDDFTTRKHTTDEPTLTISVEQNIVTALKSLGRAG